MSTAAERHVVDDDLVLHFYGESPHPAPLDAHLDVCAACRARREGLWRTLSAVTDETVAGGPAPEFGAREVERAWQALGPRLAAERRRARIRRFMAPLALAASLVLAFTVGRRWPATPTEARGGGTQRILLVAVGDHLERSEMLLVELVNAPSDQPMDIGSEQIQAQELVGASRLYRAAVTRAGEPGLASVLEELERLLVEVAHRPSEISPDELASLRRRIESRGLLFKVRVLEWQVREKQKEPAPGVAAVS
jgi:hypothetical protein